MKHDHALVMGAVSLVKGRVRNDIAIITEVRDEVERLMPSDFFGGAPFERISLMLRYGQQSDVEPTYLGIKDGWLNIAIELDMPVLRRAPRAELKSIVKAATLDAVGAAALKFKLNREPFRREREAMAAS